MALKSDYELSQVGEVVETKNIDKVNPYLKIGWILIGTHMWDFGHPVERNQKTVYCLGWPRSMGEPIHPKIKGKNDDIWE